MADYDSRPRRGGGQFHNRKRRFRDDDFNDRRPQRRRYEEPIAITLRKQVLSIAESPVRKVEDDIVTIAKTLADNYFDSDLTSAFLELATELIVEQPLKIPFIASIVLHVNPQKPEFVTEVLSKVQSALQKVVEAGDWKDVKLYLRFLAVLQGIFEGDGIFPLLDEVFNRAAELQTKSSDDALGLELVKIILLTLPYTMASSARGFEEQADSLLEKTDIIASTPHPLEILIQPYFDQQDDTTSGQPSTIALLQKHMQEEAKKGWQLTFLPRPWKTDSPEEDNDPLLSAQKHPFPAVSIPEDIPIGPRQIFPEVYFSVYSDQEIETVPSSSHPASVLLRDVLSDTINGLHYNRSVAAKFLIELDCYFAPDTFVKRATPFDKLRDIEGEKASWKPEDIVVDAAFSQLFKLPSTEQKLIYYHSVLTEACKLAPAAVAPSLGRAIRFLYRSVARMDVELIQRFLDWFSHHLSNFGFTWKWVEWVDDIELSNLHPKKAFIIDALDKEIRLSFAQRIKGTLPEPYQALISTAKEKDSPDFKYNDSSQPFSTQGQELAALIRRKATDDEFEPILSKIEEDATSSGVSHPQLASTDALITAMCWVGSKSLSHFLSCVERCKERLLKIANSSQDARKQIITSTLDYWHDQAGVGVAIVDKLLNYQIITPGSVVEWALIDHVQRGTVLSKAWCYEMVSGTTTKVAGRVRGIVRAVRRPQGLDEEKKQNLEKALEEELESMKMLFAMVEDALRPVSEGNQDEMMESSDQLREEEEELLREWGRKWIRAFRRKGAVEESWVREELIKPLPVVEEEEVVKEANGDHKMGDVATEGADTTNGDEQAAKKLKFDGETNGGGHDDGADGIE